MPFPNKGIFSSWAAEPHIAGYMGKMRQVELVRSLKLSHRNQWLYALEADPALALHLVVGWQKASTNVLVKEGAWSHASKPRPQWNSGCEGREGQGMLIGSISSSELADWPLSKSGLTETIGIQRLPIREYEGLLLERVLTLGLGLE